jgi:hypothetical protein
LAVTAGAETATVDALTLPEQAAALNLAVHLSWADRQHTESNPTVGEQQPVPWSNVRGQRRIGRAEALPAAQYRLRGDRELGALSQTHRATVQLPDAYLRSLQVLKDRHSPPGSLSRRPHPADPASMLALRAVRKVKPDDVDAGSDQRLNGLRAVRSRTKRRDDLRALPPAAFSSHNSLSRNGGRACV